MESTGKVGRGATPQLDFGLPSQPVGVIPRTNLFIIAQTSQTSQTSQAEPAPLGVPPSGIQRHFDGFLFSSEGAVPPVVRKTRPLYPLAFLAAAARRFVDAHTVGWIVLVDPVVDCYSCSFASG